MLHQSAFYDLLNLPYEEEGKKTAKVVYQASTPGEVDGIALAMEGDNNPVIAYHVNNQAVKRYKFIISDTFCSNRSPNDIVIMLLNAMVRYGEVYLWEGTKKAFANLKPI